MQAHLIVLLGPTAVGKTDVSIRLAQALGMPIISADSRQIYKGLKIGTASPEAEFLEKVPHYFIEKLAVDTYYNASMYETDVLETLDELFKTHQNVLLTGGSMMYIDAVTKGIDNMPDVDPDLRTSLLKRFEDEGLEALRLELNRRDPVFYASVDLKNHSRIIHALEICIQTGKPYSSFLTNGVKKRPFNIIKIGLDRDREELYDRINKRVEIMVADGLEEEVRTFLPHRDINALNTVGYKEMFKYIDGEYDLARAIELIQRNSRRYAKKQLSWFRRDKEIEWFHPDNWDGLISHVNKALAEESGISDIR